MFTIITAAAHTEMTLLEVVKSELEITGSSNDGMLTEYIQQASDYIRTYTGRYFAKETVEETFQSRGGRKLMVSRYPLVSISFIEFSGTSVGATTYEIDNSTAGIIWREAGFTHTILSDEFITLQPTKDGRRDWKVRYVAGYNMPGTTGVDRDFPYDLERACVDLVKNWFLTKTADPMIQRQQTGDASETRFATSRGVPPGVLNTLNNWRKLDL
ncbi:hypothetical protein CL634_07330 [bacterium]|nr:hypothetical protein [bacterium]|tara:strand:- start:1572 stop:2213 length:642 start_codon:yes stop_codon:yes gene_type:complete